MSSEYQEQVGWRPWLGTWHFTNWSSQKYVGAMIHQWLWKLLFQLTIAPICTGIIIWHCIQMMIFGCNQLQLKWCYACSACRTYVCSHVVAYYPNSNIDGLKPCCQQCRVSFSADEIRFAWSIRYALNFTYFTFEKPQPFLLSIWIKSLFSRLNPWFCNLDRTLCP